MTTPTGPELLRRVIDARLSDVHTSMPGKVASFDAVAQTVDVQPMIKNVISGPEGETEESYPVIRSVPVTYPRSGTFVMAYPLVAGDFVMIHFAEWSIDYFMEKGLEAHPVDLERHAFSGATASPCGPYPSASPIVETIDGLIVGHDGGAVLRIKDDGTIAMGSTAGTKQPAALGDDTKSEINALRTTVAAAVNALALHVHPTAATGPPSIATPGVGGMPVSAPPTVGDVGSSKVSVEE